MSALWTAAEAARATGGTARGDWEAMGVSIDTRTLRPGDLFVALKDQRDGHDFVADALAKGAAAALVSRMPDGVAADAPLLIVDDVLDGLTALGRAGRERTRARVIAVTGSVGKTSTKEMLRAALAPQGKVHAAEASYNNHWGVPLTLARMPADTDFAVIEIGMNHPGEIEPLARLARPHVAIVTIIAPAHLAAFENMEGIAREKAAIFAGLEPGGTAILNGDVSTAGILKAAAEGSSAGRVISFGENAGADYRAEDIQVGEAASVLLGSGGGPRARLSAGGRAEPSERFVFKIGAPGRHFALNALAALIAVEAAGGDWDIAALDLAGWSPPAGRGTRETLTLDVVEDHMTIDLIDDAFNANPTSLSAALDVLAASDPVDDIGRVARGRRIVVLGDMLELGPESERLHADIANHPAMQKVALVHCVGPLMAHLWEALPEAKRGRRVESAEDLASRAHQLVDAGDVVLVKGSKGSRVSLVAAAIRKLGQSSAAAV